jgi:actin-related protein 4
MLERKNITVNPRYLVTKKEQVPLGEPINTPVRKFGETITSSFHEFQILRVLDEFKESMAQVHDAPLTSDIPEETFSKRIFEFPDGSNYEFGLERYQVAEPLFRPKEYPLDDEAPESPEQHDEDTQMADDEDAKTTADKEKDKELHNLLYTDRTTGPFATTGVSDMIIDSINACDVDIRANLANNIVITGGASLIQGFTDRVNDDLTQGLPGFKIRIHAPGNTVERKFSAWIGGSILASLGTFHQLWISKKEYQEVGGAKLLEKRFR